MNDTTKMVQQTLASSDATFQITVYEKDEQCLAAFFHSSKTKDNL